jgi:hypothetical protein
LLTLVVTPVAYSLFDDLSATARWRALASRVGSSASPLTDRLRRPTERRSARRRDAAADVETSATAEQEKVEIGAGLGD